MCRAFVMWQSPKSKKNTALCAVRRHGTISLCLSGSHCVPFAQAIKVNGLRTYIASTRVCPSLATYLRDDDESKLGDIEVTRVWYLRPGTVTPPQRCQRSRRRHFVPYTRPYVCLIWCRACNLWIVCYCSPRHYSNNNTNLSRTSFILTNVVQGGPIGGLFDALFRSLCVSLSGVTPTFININAWGHLL